MSQVPPPYPPSAPPVKRDRTGMIILFIILGLIGFCIIAAIAIGLFSWNFGKRMVGPIAGCAISFEAARTGIMEYAKANGGRLPKAETWQDDIRQYVGPHLNKSRDAQRIIDAKTMQADGDWGCYVSDSKMTGMAFNSELSEILLTDVSDPFNTIVLFEIEAPRRNAAEPYRLRPDSTSPQVFGEPRGWVYMPLEGGMRGMENMNEGANWRSSTPEADESNAAPSSESK